MFSNPRNRRRWLITAGTATLSVAGFLLISKNRSEPPVATTVARAAANPTATDTISLAALEQALLAAGEIQDPDLRERRTREIGDALIRFHVEAAEAASGKALPAGTGSAADPASNGAKEAEPTYDVAQLRAEFESTLAIGDSHERRLGIGAVAEFLATYDPATARSWLQEFMSDGRISSADAYYFTSVFTQTYARTDPQAAVRWAEFLPPESLLPVAYQRIATEWSALDFDAMTAWSESIEDPFLRSNVIRTIGNSLSNAPDDLAAAWARRLAGNEQDGPRHSDVVVQHWSRADLDAALEWTRSLPEADDVARAVDGLAMSFTAQQPAAAAQWAVSFPEGPARDQAITLTANRWAVDRPQAAADWLTSLGRPDLLEASFPSIMASWDAVDPAGARQWAGSVPVRPDLRDYVLKMFDR
jgi:hypothetical protein